MTCSEAGGEGPFPVGDVRQDIILRPVKRAGSGLVAGWLDPATGQACVRTYARLCALHERRHGRALPIAEPDYAAFRSELEAFLAKHHFDVEVEGATSRRLGLRASGWWVAVLLLLVGLAVAWLAS